MASKGTRKSNSSVSSSNTHSSGSGASSNVLDVVNKVVNQTSKVASTVAERKAGGYHPGKAAAANSLHKSGPDEEKEWEWDDADDGASKATSGEKRKNNCDPEIDVENPNFTTPKKLKKGSSNTNKDIDSDSDVGANRLEVYSENASSNDVPPSNKVQVLLVMILSKFIVVDVTSSTNTGQNC